VSGWDDPTGAPYYAVGICDRCNRRFLLHELIQDGNLPGLRVCKDDWDMLDPYRLPARQSDNLILPFVRPDVPLTISAAATFLILTESNDPLITEDDDYIVQQ
jgi:hypothetical protein